MAVVTVTRHDCVEEEAIRKIVPNDVLDTFEVPALDEAAMVAAMRRCLAQGRVGKRRTEVADVARILVEHGAHSVSAGGEQLWQDAHAALPQVAAARAQLTEEDQVRLARLDDLGVTQERIKSLHDHPMQRATDDEERAYGVNLAGHAAHGRCWWIEEQGWAALRKAWGARVQELAEEVAREYLARRSAAFTPFPPPFLVAGPGWCPDCDSPVPGVHDADCPH